MLPRVGAICMAVISLATAAALLLHWAWREPVDRYKIVMHTGIPVYFFLLDTMNGDVWMQDLIGGVEGWRKMPKVRAPTPLDTTGLKPAQ